MVPDTKNICVLGYKFHGSRDPLEPPRRYYLVHTKRLRLVKGRGTRTEARALPASPPSYPGTEKPADPPAAPRAEPNRARPRDKEKFLAQFPGPGPALDTVLTYLRKHQREEIRELLCTSMEDYAPSEVNLEDFFQTGKYECEAARNAGLPGWVLDALAKGKLAPFISDALILRSTFLHVQVENMQRPSAHSTALPIRQVIYGLLLNAPRGPEAASPSRQSKELPVVCEFDRLQKTLKKTFVQAASLPTDFCDDHFPLDKLTEVPRSRRQMLLLETLRVKMSFMESIPSHLQLPVAVTCYWICCSEPKVNLHQLKALFLMIVFGELHRITEDPGFTVGPLCTDCIKSSNQHLR
ncbi:PREDICTED: protein asteroid homolog 1 [Chaetura pelagica]|uniref:protein asteroid homolog 1 n=1 Tax=Chaetura pelagica TaxID=8897 RepID=UPI000523EA38|nr:PREDICTED: protein asteroid homolog 1 [Chaetura pelagica]